jgi:predicted DNA-binding transcriptional regulator YafY
MSPVLANSTSPAYNPGPRTKEGPGLRYEKLEVLLRVALDMRGTAEGLSLEDIQHAYDVSRRTAERMRDAIERVFPQMEQANPGEVPKRWRIRAGVLGNIIGFSVEEFAALTTAANLARRENLHEAASRLEIVSAKLKSLIQPQAARRIGPDPARLVRKNIVKIASPVQHAHNFGDIILHSIENDVRTRNDRA